MTAADLLGGWQPLGGPVLGALLAGALYAAGVRAVAPAARRGRAGSAEAPRGAGRSPAARPWPAWRSACFAAGLLVLAWALASGLDTWAERRLSVHMVQHLALGLVVAPLLVAGAPERLALRALHGRPRRRLGRALHGRVARVLLHPAVGAAAFAGVMLGTHLTGLYVAALRHPLVHEGEHLVVLAAGALLAASLVRAGPIARLVAVTAATIPMGIVGAWLGWAQTVRYAPYRGPGALHDQAVGAAIMWAGAALPLAVGAVALAGVALWREEQRQRRREAIAA